MATVKQYVTVLLNARNRIALAMGVSVPGTDKVQRALVNANLAAVAILAKALVDKGVLTDADLTAARDSAVADLWDEEPNLP